jgi:hypothetical protein
LGVAVVSLVVIVQAVGQRRAKRRGRGRAGEAGGGSADGAGS